MARRLIGFSLKRAVLESQLPEDPRLSLAKDLAPDSHVQLLLRLSQLHEKALKEAEEETEMIEAKTFSDELKWLVRLSEEVEEILANTEKQ